MPDLVCHRSLCHFGTQTNFPIRVVVYVSKWECGDFGDCKSRVNDICLTSPEIRGHPNPTTRYTSSHPTFIRAFQGYGPVATFAPPPPSRLKLSSTTVLRWFPMHRTGFSPHVPLSASYYALFHSHGTLKVTLSSRNVVFSLTCHPAWNTGTCLYMIWTGLACLIFFINSVVWNSDVINKAPVWCDICTCSTVFCFLRIAHQLCSHQAYCWMRGGHPRSIPLHKPSPVPNRFRPIRDQDARAQAT